MLYRLFNYHVYELAAHYVKRFSRVIIVFAFILLMYLIEIMFYDNI